MMLNRHHLVKVASAGFLCCEVTRFPFVINKHLGEGSGGETSRLSCFSANCRPLILAIMGGSCLQQLLLWRLPNETCPHFAHEASGAHRVEVTCPGPHKPWVSSVTILPWPPSQGKSQSLDKHPEGRPQSSCYLSFIFHPTVPLTLLPWATMASLLFLKNAPVSGPLNWLFPQLEHLPFANICFAHSFTSLSRCSNVTLAARPSLATLFIPPTGLALQPPPLFAFSAPDVLFLLIFTCKCKKVTLTACQPSSLSSPRGQGVWVFWSLPHPQCLG